MSKNQFLPPKVRRPREELAHAVKAIETTGCVVAGSWRRQRDTVGDLDAIVKPHQDFEEMVETFVELFGYEPIRSGSMKSEGIVPYRDGDLLINLWRVPKPEAWAAMLLFATGPHDLNIMMRACAKGRGWKLSQYGLFDDEEHQRDRGEDEAQIFALLGLPVLTPSQRENWKEQGLGIYIKAGETVEIGSSDGVTVYRVTMKNGTAVNCECKGFSYRHQCRHLAEAEAKVKSG